jgi:hypothetical protein
MIIDIEQMQLDAQAELFKLQVEDSINKWYAASPLRTGMPHASAILAREKDFCLRQLVLQAVVPDEAKRPALRPWDSKKPAYFLQGWSLHEKYQKLFTSFWQVVEVEKPHYDEEDLLWFTPDAIVKFQGERALVEIKGYNDEACTKIEDTRRPPIDAHKQANLYLYFLRLDKAYILVENKNNQGIDVWCVRYSPELAQPYIDRLQAFKTALEVAESASQLPSRCCTSLSDKQALSCPMREYCFNNYQ